MIDVYNTTSEQGIKLLANEGVLTHEQMVIMYSYINLSRPLLSVFHGRDFLSLFGFIPETLISDNAYLWMHCADKVRDHRVTFARKSKEVLTNILNTYPQIGGHCTTFNSRQWLGWLGAEFSHPTDGFWPFMIRRSNG